VFQQILSLTIDSVDHGTSRDYPAKRFQESQGQAAYKIRRNLVNAEADDQERRGTTDDSIPQHQRLGPKLRPRF
jgi:hypothetical protein